MRLHLGRFEGLGSATPLTVMLLASERSRYIEFCNRYMYVTTNIHEMLTYSSIIFMFAVYFLVT